MGKLKLLWNNMSDQILYMKWLFQYSKPYTGKILLLMLLDLLVTFATLALALISKKIIDVATSGGEFLPFIIVYLIIVLITQIVSVLSNLFSTMMGEKFSFGIRKQIYEKIINSHWMDVKKYHTGDLMTRLTSDASNISDGIIGTIPSIIQLIVELFLVFFTLFYYSKLLAVFALVIAPIASLMAWWLGKKLKRLQVKVQESEAAYRSFLQESLANLLIVKAFANEDYSAERLTDLREDRFFWVFKKTKLGLVSSTTMSLSFQLGYIVAFAYGATQIAFGAITYGTMSVFLTLVNRVQAPIMQLTQKIPKLVSIFASAGRIIELQDIPLEERKKEQIEAENIGLDIKNLTFGYSDEAVLEDTSLQIKVGEFIAIVGESGIGKTTLLRLIMSFMNDAKGSVFFYNQKGETVEANAATREFIAYVPQGNTLFSGTIRENIRMGKLDASEEEMIEALKLASAYEFIMELPKGLNTVIGERGHGLSEGQAQRISIARAFVRRAPFLILDEATSALDEETELEVLQGLNRLQPKPTCLIVTHRKSILRYCDREIKIENKKMMEA